VYPEVWDVEDTFGEVHGELSTYLTADALPLHPTLALRAAGKKVFGDFPFFEAAFVGGASTVRGLREQRYAGDAAVYGNAELRLALGRVVLLLPTEVGIFGLADAGRVFLEGESSSEIHTGFGGGLSLSFLTPANTLTFAFVRGEDRNGFYLRAGFGY
jgi:hemolysin activation/secretion protein